MAQTFLLVSGKTAKTGWYQANKRFQQAAHRRR